MITVQNSLKASLTESLLAGRVDLIAGKTREFMVHFKLKL